jgi:translocation and assembly module TamA
MGKTLLRSFIFFLALCLPPSLWAAVVEPLKIVVEGLEGELAKNVERALTLPPGIVQNGGVDGVLLERFQAQIPQRVNEALEPLGYYHSRTAVVRERTEEGQERIRVHVDRGEPVRISRIHVAIQGPGAQAKELQDLQRAFPLREGEILHQGKYEKGKKALEEKALDLGYLDARFTIHAIRISRNRLQAEIELVLQTGPQYRFGKITFLGPSLYPDSFLRRHLTFQTGEVFSYAKIGQTQLQFSQSDRFKEVRIVPRKEAADDGFVPIEIHLDPSAPKRLRPGVGYSTDTGARLSLRYQDVNFFQTGHEWNADLSLAERSQEVVTRYILPSPKDIDTFSSIRLGYKQERTKSYDSKILAFEPERVQSLGSGRIGSLFLRLHWEEYRVADLKRHSQLTMPGVRYSHRSYDNLIRPTRGYRYVLETRGALKDWGSDTGFIQLLMEGYSLYPLPARLSLLGRAQAGFTLLQDPLEDLPASLRFFAGGDRSVRGYTYQSLGPKDQEGKVVGGRNLLVGSLELERSFFDHWAAAVFYDLGNAFNNLGEIRLAQGAGIGLRYYSRVGPLRLDLARQINVPHPGYQIHLSMGFML